jgi:hypothetical protein
MIDGLGNKLQPGQLVWWVPKQMICKVLKVEEPVLSAGDVTDITLTLEVQLLDQAKRGKEYQASGFMRLVDPASDKLLDGLMGGGKPS